MTSGRFLLKEIVVDAGYLGSGRQLIHGLVELDVTKAREIERHLEARGNIKLSFTAFIVTSFAKAIELTPEVQAYRDRRGRIIVFH